MSRYLMAAVGVAVSAAAVLFAGTAAAQPGDAPISGDDRATAYAGNKVAQDCAELFPGSHAIANGDLTATVDGSNTYIDITGIADGVALVGVVVKGGPAYNVYEPGDLGALPWQDLHSPLVPSGKPAQISHWFACGSGGTTTTTSSAPETTETTGTETTTETTETTETTTSGESAPATTTSPGGEVVATTTTSAAVAPAASDEDLASTGFNGGWLIALGAALLLGGGAVLLLLRTRAARR